MKKNWLKWIIPTAIVGGALYFFSDAVFESRPETNKTPASLTERVNKITFEEAKEDESKRQAYIDQLLSQYGRPYYLVSVYYEPKEDCYKGDDELEVYQKLNVRGAMATGGVSGKFYEIGKRKIPVKTRITRTAFKGSEEFFMLALFSHERTVARCIHEGLRQVPTDTAFYHEDGKEKVSNNLLTLLFELEACASDLEFCRDNHLSKQVENECIRQYKNYYHALATGFPDVPEESREKIANAVSAYSRDDLD